MRLVPKLDFVKVGFTEKYTCKRNVISLEGKKIAAIAEIFNAQLAPHLYAGPVEWAASIQLAATVPNLLMVETIQTGGEFHKSLINDAITWHEGYIELPSGPGLGIEFNKEVARAHPWKGSRLHLEMQEEPSNSRRNLKTLNFNSL